MRKSILGAGAALAFAAGSADAQTQAPAPVVPAVLPSATPDPGVAPAQAVYGADPVFGGGPVVGSAPVGGGGGPSSRFYTEGSFLLMWASSPKINVPLATTGPSLGILGRPGTTTLIGNSAVNYPVMPGFKVAAGGFLGDSRMGWEANGFYLGRVMATPQSIGPTAAITVARPFFDPNTRAQNSTVIAAPGAFTGGLALNNAIQAWGFETNPFWRVAQGDAVTLDLITGFRYFQSGESLDVFGSSNLLAGGTSSFNGTGVANGGRLLTHDHFSGVNTFYGGNLGARASAGRGRFFVDLTGKIALGAVTEHVGADGSTTLLQGGGVRAPATVSGGFLTAGGNIGTRTDSRFAVLPEADLKLGFQVTEWANVFAGFSFLYLSSAARPADQLGNQVAFPLSTLPTATTFRPVAAQSVGVVSDDLWLYGFNFGLTLSY